MIATARSETPIEPLLTVPASEPLYPLALMIREKVREGFPEARSLVKPLGAQQSADGLLIR